MLKTRLFTASFLIAGFLAALFLLPDLYWASLMLVIIVLGAWEWGRLANFVPADQRAFTALTLVVGIALLPDLWPAAMVALQHHALFWGVLAAALLWLVLVPIWLLSHHRETCKPLLALAGALVLLSSWLALVHLRKVSPWLVLGVMVAVWIADSAAYFSGRAFGRHKLAPEISPGKTWEGVAGAGVAVSLYGLVLCLAFDISFWLVVGLWGLTVMSIVGDLFESLLKRQAGLKDSGSLLPGHGGVLDRVDGLLPVLPLVAFCIDLPLYYAVFHE
ncbi:MAG: phosphatidate cytidylyltransferase [Methylophilales bacterium RIFCSPHIGHO2_02_FULL_57_10]|nr:MAG: phosphatidate cytidylyltransferase [Methylophilales bacterium RIFCSPHIGHO2_02_FULL_57_10]